MKRIEENLEKLYKYILDYTNINQYLPTVREMGEFLNIKSTSTISYYLDALQKQGKIERTGKFKARSLSIFENEKKASQKIPLVGAVAAGKPILAVENIEENFYIPNNLFKGEDLFMLKVRGDSMIEAGIFSHDYVVVKKQNFAQNGDIVVALIDDSATVKRFFKENGRIRLQPENENLKPIFCDSVEILGRVVGLIRPEI